jgi:hypothetical protein
MLASTWLKESKIRCWCSGAPRSGIAHRERDAPPVAGPVAGRHRERHLALFGELHGVTQQIDQYLAQPPRVTRDYRRYPPIHSHRELQPSLFRARQE